MAERHPPYMSELAPAEIRAGGQSAAFINTSVVFRPVIVFIVNYLVVAKECLLMCWFPVAGRSCVFAQVVPSIAMLAITLFLPESPAWCARNNRSVKPVR